MEARMFIIIFSFGFTGIILSAAEEVKSLTGVVGGNITFPDSLKESGFLLRDRKIIAMVDKNNLTIRKEIYRDKFHWNKKTGKFTIKNLQRNDSGIYNFDYENAVSIYNLTVYDSAPPPAVKRLNDGSDTCLLECSVDKNTKLSWYKDGKILNQSSSDLSLTLIVDKQDFNYSYRCVSANPAESKTHPVNISSFCREENKAVGRDANQRHYWIVVITLLSILSILIIVLVTWMIKRNFMGQERTIRQTQGRSSEKSKSAAKISEKRWFTCREHEEEDVETVNSEQKEEEVQYTQIHIKADRHNQGGSLPDSSGVTQRLNSLTTVYDKLEAHRILPSDPAVNV